MKSVWSVPRLDILHVVSATWRFGHSLGTFPLDGCSGSVSLRIPSIRVRIKKIHFCFGMQSVTIHA